jgi:hypothetical protein
MHVYALCELEFSMWDGYGVGRLTNDGCRLILQARDWEHTHKANMFLSEWFPSRPAGEGSLDGTESTEEERAGAELRPCSNELCGRRETRMHEFRRCSMCNLVN